MNKKIIFSIVLIAILGLFFGCAQVAQKNDFLKVDGSICKIDGKPVVRMFSTTWCPHCEWIKPTFDSVAKEYVDANKIIAFHWQVDIQDNTLTDTNEGSIPASEMAVFNQFNPNGSIPTFVFGCKYYRIGNGFEAQKDLNAERAEFVKIIEQLIKEN
ncbi:MAG: thioredoxin family protein [archaeon]|jgi:thiol-disulfide isomerase/thioredoxin